MVRKIVTLDFDGRNIRMLVVRGNRVLRWASVSVPQDLMNQGLITEPDQVAAGLNRLLATHRAPRRRLITSVTGHRMVSRMISMPRIKPQMLDEAIRRKAKQEMPLPLDQTYLSWQVIGQENNHLQIYAFAVPRLIIDRQMEVLKAAKIRPRAMDLQPLALARAVNQPNAIIVNLEEQSVGVILVVDGIPAILRSVPQGADVSEPEARIERLSQELFRTTQFYDEGHQTRPLDPKTVVYMTGSLFESQEMRQMMAEKTSFPVKVPNPPFRMAKDFPITSYVVNLGLALKKV
ncbi:MAG: hypothetical protein BMS9Abin28_0818 [Anaerolineae bacterium]|nr:MAG: hypothetical protein BMS9Abin28_0818 [Anaerolineae bacterium]